MITELSRQRLLKAKEVPLISLIKELGYKLEETGNYFRMLSPFRAESNASMDINKRTPNKFTDRGTGYHGDVVDFVQELFNMNKRDAIEYLLKRSNIPLPEYAPVKREHNSIEIVSLQSLTDTIAPKLIEYLTQRHIDPQIACRWLKYAQIRFPYSIKNPDRVHHCLAWGNDSGGYEFRNSFLKVSNAPKNVTTIKGGEIISLFEGWPDYLTCLTQNKTDKLGNTAMVLNSISFLNVMMPFLKGHSISYWGQNDKAGDKALQQMRDEGMIVWDRREYYKESKDFNDFVCGIKKPVKISKKLQF